MKVSTTRETFLGRSIFDMKYTETCTETMLGKMAEKAEINRNNLSPWSGIERMSDTPLFSRSFSRHTSETMPERQDTVQDLMHSGDVSTGEVPVSDSVGPTRLKAHELPSRPSGAGSWFANSVFPGLPIQTRKRARTELEDLEDEMLFVI